MKCPKCNVDQTSEIECEACGVIFEKFYKLLEKRSGSNESVHKSKPISSEGKYYKIFTIMIIVIFCAVGFWIISGIYGTIKLSQIQDKTKKVETAKKNDSTEGKNLTGIAKQLYDFQQPQTIIEKAQIATVFIKTPWGLGSGFFINGKCDIITNKHVVEFDEKKVKDLRYKVEMLEKMIERDEGQIEKVELMIAKLNSFEHIEDMNQRLKKAQKKIESMKNEYERLNANLEKVQYGPQSIEYEIILFDESIHIVTETIYSEKYDLALIKINQDDCPCLKRGDTKKVRTGQKVYTIGNPLGLSSTVTSGIISGQRSHDDVHYLQTDASINPGNSGGPLINENGQVIGINTMILVNTEGIGFAIPIETALQEFKL